MNNTKKAGAVDAPGLFLSGRELAQVQLLGENPGQVVVDDVNADFFRALAAITKFFLQVFHHEADIGLDFLIVGLEGFQIKLLDRSPEIFVVEEGVEHLFSYNFV